MNLYFMLKEQNFKKKFKWNILYFFVIILHGYYALFLKESLTDLKYMHPKLNNKITVTLN